MAIVIQLENHTGILLSTQKFTKSRIVIGRALDCDLVLQDPYVEPYHMEIEQDAATGNLRARDLHSTNGVWRLQEKRKTLFSHKKRRQTQTQSFFSGQAFEIGHTVFRVYSESHISSPALPISRWDSIVSSIAHWWIAIPIILLGIIFNVGQQYLSYPDWGHIREEFVTLLIPVFMAACYAIFCQIISRNRGGGWYCFCWVSFVYLLLTLVEFFSDAFAFNVGIRAAKDWLIEISGAVALYFALYVPLTIATRLALSLRTVVSGFLPIVMLSIFIVEAFNTEEFSQFPLYEDAIVEPMMQFRKIVDGEEFLQKTQYLYQ
jgi:hypothetical protein